MEEKKIIEIQEDEQLNHPQQENENQPSEEKKDLPQDDKKKEKSEEDRKTGVIKADTPRQKPSKSRRQNMPN